MLMRSALVFAALLALVAGHGHLTYPPSTRHGGSMELGNDCKNQACLWFSNNVEIPGNISLPNDMRTVQLNVTGLPQDVYATSPWRAPGSAPVFGSGCGVAGGSKDEYLNGGIIRGFPQGMDGLKLPKSAAPPEVWKRGETAEIAWAVTANHGGGYSYRICPADGTVNEECFQKHPLDFAGDTSDILYPNGTRVTFPLKSTRVGTSPPGSQWARDPIPGCYMCDAYETCGTPMTPVPGTGDVCAPCTTQAQCEATTGGMGNNCSWYKNGTDSRCYEDTQASCRPMKTEATCEATADKMGNKCVWFQGKGYPNGICYDKATPNDPAHKWNDQVDCYGACDGSIASKAAGACPAGTEQFEPPRPGQYSGLGKGGWAWSVADKVKVPTDIKPGMYLLSWRWDCEESTQVWQNCADIQIM